MAAERAKVVEVVADTSPYKSSWNHSPRGTIATMGQGYDFTTARVSRGNGDLKVASFVPHESSTCGINAYAHREKNIELHHGSGRACML